MGQQNVLSVFFHFSLFYWVEVFTLCKETKKGGKRHRVGHSIALYKIRKGQTPFFFLQWGKAHLVCYLAALNCFQ